MKVIGYQHVGKIKDHSVGMGKKTVIVQNQEAFIQAHSSYIEARHV
jgi:hypothetical protein